MKRDAKHIEILVGLFLLFGMVLLGGLILRFSSIREWFRERDQFTVVFSDASGLSVGAPVRLGGTTIGRVDRAPRLNDAGKVAVGITVYRDAENRIPRGSRLTIAKEGLLGDAFIAITRPESTANGYHPAGESLIGSTTTGLDTLQESAGKISGDVEALVAELREGVEDFNATVARLNEQVLSDENAARLKSALASMDSALKKIDEQVLSEENTTAVKDTLASLRVTSTSLSEKVNRLDPILDKGESAMTSFGQAADTFKQSGAAFTKAAEKAGRTLGQASDGDGLLAALLNDKKLRDDFKTLVANLRSRGVIFYKDKDGSEAASPPAPSRRVPFEAPRPPGR